MERKGHMVGVVVSWDPEMRAPQGWIDRMYANSEVSDSLTGKQLLLLWSPRHSRILLVKTKKCTLYFFLSLYMLCTHAGHQSRKYTSL